MAELIPFVLLLGLMWFMLIRPQQSRLRKQRELISSIEVGDVVLTAGGMIGTVRVLTDDELRLEVSPGVELRVVRAAISRRLTADASAEGDDTGPVDDDESEPGSGRG
ncbi:hypothetical protein BH24ACT2_BH24ACT2_10660 [soil metagenome]|jgi:preprotein translocase subunit YajC|nr:preprotein translocase subunit YajC [Acidimicrobiia bacterium]